MNEGDAFPLGADSRRLIDEAEARGPTTFEGGVEVVDGETDVMNARAARGDKLADGGSGVGRFEELDERIAGSKANDARTIGVIEGYLFQLENVSIERQDGIEVADGDADMGDRGTATGRMIHRKFFSGAFRPGAMYNQGSANRRLK